MWTTQRFRRICFIVVVVNSLFGALSAYVWPSHAYVMFVAMCIYICACSNVHMASRCPLLQLLFLLLWFLLYLCCYMSAACTPQMLSCHAKPSPTQRKTLKPYCGVASFSATYPNWHCLCVHVYVHTYIPTYLQTYTHTYISTLIPIYRHAHTRRLIVANAISFKSTHRYLANIST